MATNSAHSIGLTNTEQLQSVILQILSNVAAQIITAVLPDAFYPALNTTSCHLDVNINGVVNADGNFDLQVFPASVEADTDVATLKSLLAEISETLEPMPL